MKVGLITLHDYNYGSALQAFASQQFIEGRYCHCQIIETANPYHTSLTRLIRGAKLLAKCLAYPGSIRSMLAVLSSQRAGSLRLTLQSLSAIRQFTLQSLSTEKQTWRQLCDAAKQEEYAAFLAGSDQVWNGARVESTGFFFLRFAPADKRIAWAPSFGGDAIAPYNRRAYQKYIREFAFLSAREQRGAALIKELTGRDAIVLPDPVMLLSAGEWRARCKKYVDMRIQHQADYVLLFFIDPPTERALAAVAAMLGEAGMPIFSFGYQHSAFTQWKGWQHIDGSPWDFLHIIDNASMVMTDSYHATVFSSMFSTPFYTFSRNYQHDQDQSIRITSLLAQLGLEDRFDPSLCALNAPRDFSEVEAYFVKEKKKAEAYLDTALKIKPREIPNTAHHSVYEHPSLCCGCGACACVCSKHAITMQVDSTGVLYPCVDQASCTHCGACERVCPMKADVAARNDAKRAYMGYWTNAQAVERSASGGAFAMLADQIISDGGMVYGAAMIMTPDEKPECRHLAVNGHEQLPRLQGSKYMQSYTTGIFSDVKANLEKGVKVLFSGTSCQVAALQRFLGKDYDHLYTVDLICHGVPQNRLMNDYVAYLEKKYKCKVLDISFRRKDKGHFGEANMPFILTVYCQDKGGKKYERLISLRNSAYYRLFMSAAGYRDSCYSCRYASVNKPADITLGDYYADRSRLETLDPKHRLQWSQYLSCVLVHTEHGKQLLNMCKGFTCVEVGVDQAIDDHAQLSHPSLPSKTGEVMYGIYKHKGMEGLQRYIDHRNFITLLPGVGKKMVRILLGSKRA